MKIALLIACSFIPIYLIADSSATNEAVSSESKLFIYYTLENNALNYYLTDDKKIHPGMIRKERHIIWTNEVILLSQYMYGGPHHRIALINIKDVDPLLENSPEDLIRFEMPLKKGSQHEP